MTVPDIAPDPMTPLANDFPVETERRLSESLLWQLQRRYFERQGVAAWSSGAVPSHVTTNPAFAWRCAALALGLLRDQIAAGAVFDQALPFTIIELGAGSGRFACHFITAFRSLLALSPFAGLPFRYVATDFAPTNLAFWRSHDALAVLIAEGVLDVARFDAETDTSLLLEGAGAVLGPDSLPWPPLVIANYVFDGISQDAFIASDGVLAECRVTLRTRRADLDLDDPAAIASILCSYSSRALDGPPYAEPLFDGILCDYAGSLSDTTFLFPVGTLRCLGRLAALAGGALVLLTADRGEQLQEDLQGRDDLALAVHGSFSLPVNYHAVAEYFVRQGGAVLTTAYRHAHIAVSAFLLGGNYAETRLAFDQAMEHFGADDFSTLAYGLRPLSEQLDLQQLLAFLRLSGWDPQMLADCVPALWQRIDTADAALRQELVAVIGRAWENYFHLGEQRDVPFLLGCLLYGLNEHGRALELFDASRRLYGDSATTCWNMGLCLIGLGDTAAAADRFAEARGLDPSFAPVTALQLKREAADDASGRKP